MRFSKLWYDYAKNLEVNGNDVSVRVGMRYAQERAWQKFYKAFTDAGLTRIVNSKTREGVLLSNGEFYKYGEPL